jgi:uncharacterized protein (TIGR00369 family)|tara:strand:- start:325 stop:729 length:405 start_codon:yes stop_codon:yes gene_type:complete
MEIKLTDDSMCFACGKKNDIGLKLDSKIEGGVFTAVFVPKKEHQGYENIIHGGIISTLLDEAMVNLAFRIGLNAVTAHFEVDFKKPAFVGEKLVIKGEILEKGERKVHARSEVRKEDGMLVAEAKGLLVKLKES